MRRSLMTLAVVGALGVTCGTAWGQADGSNRGGTAGAADMSGAAGNRSAGGFGAEAGDSGASVATPPDASVGARDSGQNRAGMDAGGGRDVPTGVHQGRQTGSMDANRAGTDFRGERSSAYRATPGDGQSSRLTTGGDDVQWRYRWHEGRWWYWTPENRWMVWTGNNWTPYTTGMVLPDTGFVGSSQTVYYPSYSYSYYPSFSDSPGYAYSYYPSYTYSYTPSYSWGSTYPYYGYTYPYYSYYGTRPYRYWSGYGGNWYRPGGGWYGGGWGGWRGYGWGPGITLGGRRGGIGFWF